MSAATDAVNRSIEAVTNLRGILGRARDQPQVRNQGEQARLAAVADLWYERDSLPIRKVATVRLNPTDELFSKILEASNRASSRTSCIAILKELRSELISVRSQVVAAESVAASTTRVTPVPSFSALVSNTDMQRILARRWQEAERCLHADAGLASVVMMGGLLEALLMARIERLADKKPVFTAKAAPKDKSGKTLPQKEWTLHNYIEICHELGWIGETARSVSVVLRDYRNYIHPYKELTDGVTLTKDDAAILWTVVATLSDQILRSATP